MPNYFLKWLYHFTLDWEIQFLPVLANICMASLYHFSYSTRYIIVSHCSFNFLMTNGIVHLFHVLIWLLCIFFGELPVEMAQFLNWVVFPIIDFGEFKCPGYQSFIKCMSSKCFLAVYSLCFHSLNSVF